MSSPRHRNRSATTALVLTVAVLDVASMGIVVPVLPRLIQESTGASNSAGVITGIFVALWSLTQFLASPVLGSISDRFGRRPVILLSACGLTFSYLIFALSSSLWLMAFGRVIAGATSASFTTVYAYVTDITPPEDRARAFGLIGAAYSVGFVLGPLLGGALAEISLHTPFWAAMAISAGSLLFCLIALPESLSHENRRPFSWRSTTTRGTLAFLRSDRQLTQLATINFLLYFGHYTLSAAFVLYCANRYELTASQVGAVLTLMGTLEAVVQGVLVGRVVKRYGEMRVMTIGVACSVLGLTAMGMAPTPLIFAIAVIPKSLWGLASTTVESLMTKQLPETRQGQLQGANMSMIAVAGVLAPLVFGAMYSWLAEHGPNISFTGTVFVFGAVIQALALTIAITLRRSISVVQDAQAQR